MQVLFPSKLTWTNVVPRACCAEGVTEPFSVTWNAFTEFCQTCALQDMKQLKLKDIDRLFIATKVPSERARVVQTVSRKSGNSLARFEFLESLVRLAKVVDVGKPVVGMCCLTRTGACGRPQKKFLNTNEAESYPEAVEMLLKNHILPLGHRVDAKKFRETHLCVRQRDWQRDWHHLHSHVPVSF